MAKHGAWFLFFVSILGSALYAQKTLQDKLSQTHTVAQDPPLVAVGDTARLVFHVSPLSGKGLLSEQTRDALKAILKLNGNTPIVHIRAFSAGNGDLRRIPQIVADVLGGKQPLPSVSVLQAGELSQNDAQIVLETISLAKKDVSKDGLTFHAAEPIIAIDPAADVKPFLQQAMDRLAAKLGTQPALSVTCYVSTLENGAALLSSLQSRFAGAAVNLVQPKRLAWQAEASCEGISRGGNTPARLAFSGTQIAFGQEEKDAALAVQRLERALREAGAPALADAALARFYVLSPAANALARKQITGTMPHAIIPVENVGSTSAGLAIDAVVPVR